MADSAFATAAYPSYTTEQLRSMVAKDHSSEDIRAKMIGEIERRERVATGDFSVMTASERLRHVRSTK